MTQFGLETPNGSIITDPGWSSMSAVIYACHGQGVKRISDTGELVMRTTDGKWKRVYNNESRH